MTPARPPLWLLYAVTVTGVLANSVLTPNLPDILADFEQPSSRAGLLVAATPLPGIFMAPVIGVLADRYGRRRVLVPCLAVFGLAAIGSIVVPNFNSLLALRFLQGLGGAGLINLAVVLIGDHWDGLDRTRLIGRNSAVLTVCLAAFPSIGGVIGEVFGWRYSLALGGVGLVLAVLVWRSLPDARPGTTRTVIGQLRGAAVVLRQPSVLSVLAAGVLLFMVIFGVFLTTLPVHLEEQFGLSAGPRGLILSSFAIGASVASFNLGRLRAHLPPRAILVGAAAIIAVAAAGLGVAPTVTLVVTASLIYGVGDGLSIPALQDLMTAAAPDEQRASVIAAWVSGVRLGQAAGPVTAAALFAATSTRTTMLIGAAVFAFVGVGLAVAPLPTEPDPSASGGEG